MKYMTLIVLTALLTGCVKSEEIEDGTAVAGASSIAAIREVKLSDGTRCVVMLGPAKGGIDCDWR